jgi:hypothetical protein
MGGPGLLLALDDQFEMDRRCRASGGGEVRPDAERVEEHLSLVVGRPPGIQPVPPDGWLERRGLPQVQGVHGLHVMVAVHDGRESSRVIGRPLGEDGRQSRGLPDLHRGEAGGAQRRGQPLGGPADVSSSGRIAGQRGDAQPLHEVGDETVSLRGDVGPDWRGAHTSEL